MKYDIRDMDCIIDSKEKEYFKKIFLDKIHGSHEGNLDIGDIEIKNEENTLILIERKEINDLASSLSDGRYHEQKTRLKSCILLGIRVIYLIEGNWEQLNKIYHKNFTREKYKGCIINTMIRDNIHIYFTVSYEDTINFVKDIMMRLPKYSGEMVNKLKNKNMLDIDKQYIECIKIKKKDNNTAKICFANQLRQINGISSTIAIVIVEKYGSWKNLIHEYDNMGDNIKELENMLSKIKIGNRNLGPVLSKRIYQFIYM